MQLSDPSKLIGKTGRVKAICAEQSMILVQLYNSEYGIMSEYWLNPSCLKHAGRCRKVEQLHVPNDAIARLIETEFNLSKLIARRAIFSLCSEKSRYSLLHTQLKLKGMDQVCNLIFHSLLEALELAQLEHLGQPLRSSATANRLVSSLIQNLNELVDNSNLGKEELLNTLVRNCKRLLDSSSRFVFENTNVREIVYVPGGNQSGKHK